MKNRLIPLADRLLLRRRAIPIVGHRPDQEHFPERACSSPQSGQLLGQSSLWINCLLASAQEAFTGYAGQFAPSCLTRTHVNYI